MNRKPYPTDVSDDERAFVAPFLTLMREDASQREHSLREVFNGVRYVVRAAGYDGAKRRKGSKVHLAVVTLGHLLALHVTAADEQDRA